MLRSCLSSGIAASDSALGATTVPATKVPFGPGIAAPNLRSPGVGLVIPGVAEAPVPVEPLALTVTAAATLGALKETGADQAEHQRASDHQRGLPTGQILQILAHSPSVLVAEIIRHLLNLAGHGVGNTRDPLLILGAEVLGGAPQRVGHGAELVGKLVLALSQAAARPIPSLLERVLGLIYDLVLHVPDLVPSVPAGLLAGGLGSGAGGLGIWRRHVVLLWLTNRHKNQPPNAAGLSDREVNKKLP